MKKIFFKTLLLFAMFVHISSATTQYVLIDLGAGGVSSINNSGQIVGGSGGHAILFDSTGAGDNINLGEGVAQSINDNGRIVGNLGTYGDGDAVIYNSLGGVERVLDSYAMISEINNNDQIAGSASNYLLDNPPRAYFFDLVSGYPNYSKTDMDRGQALSVNESSKVVGYKYWSSSGPGPFDPVVTDREAVIFDTTGGGDHIYLGYLPNREESIAEAINNNNKIVGYAFNYIDGGSVYPSDEDIAAVLFDETGGGQNLYLGGLAGFENSKALAINDYDQIVGSCFGLNTNPLNMRATLFYAEGSNVDLNTVLVNPIEGWTLSEAVAINDDGWIVGSMYNTSFNQHAFLLKPVPEPATLSFMIIGFWAAANRRRILK